MNYILEKDFTEFLNSRENEILNVANDLEYSSLIGELADDYIDIHYENRDKPSQKEYLLKLKDKLILFAYAKYDNLIGDKIINNMMF